MERAFASPASCRSHDPIHAAGHTDHRHPGNQGRHCAIACDRHGIGTNAIAIADGRNFRFAFGWASFARHLTEGGTGCARIVRPGLACDIDTPADALLMLQPHPAG